MCESKKQLDPEIIDSISEKMYRKEPDWKKELPNLSQPLLLFSGEPEKGGFVTPDVITRVKELKPDTLTVQVPEAGHLIRFDGFPVFIRELKAFLQSLD